MLSLEVVWTGLLALSIGYPMKRHCHKLDQTMEGIESLPELEAWASRNWRHCARMNVYGAVFAAPLIEEVIYRGVPVALMQLGHVSWAFILGIVINLHFAWIHKGQRGVTATHHRIGTFIVGLVLLVVGLASGLLIVAMVAHSIFNLTFGESWKEWRLSRTPNRDLEGTKLIFWFQDREVEINFTE